MHPIYEAVAPFSFLLGGGHRVGLAKTLAWHTPDTDILSPRQIVKCSLVQTSYKAKCNCVVVGLNMQSLDLEVVAINICVCVNSEL